MRPSTRQWGRLVRAWSKPISETMTAWDEDGQALLTEALQTRVSAIGLPRTRVDPAMVRLAHECGLSVFVWTVNDPADMRYLIRIGVDGIITDQPDVLLGILEAEE